VVTTGAGVPYLAPLEGEARKVARTAHEGFERELRSLGGKLEVRAFSSADVVAAIEGGAIALTRLASLPVDAGEQGAERWVVITGFDADHLYLHDPVVPAGADRTDSLHLPLKRTSFDDASHDPASGVRALLLVERWGSVSHRSPDN
jgi:hypothetical protein